MKAYKLEVLIIDHDELGKDEIIEVMENAYYPNYCVSPKIMKIEEMDIGEWGDDHPLNLSKTADDEYKRLFAVSPVSGERRAMSYATTLATAIHAKHYPEVTQWEPLPDLLGVLTQIDNMTDGLTREAPRE